jgi:hypothetical protein
MTHNPAWVTLPNGRLQWVCGCGWRSETGRWNSRASLRDLWDQMEQHQGEGDAARTVLGAGEAAAPG